MVTMDFLDKLCAVKSILLPSDEEKNKEKGNLFESYVESLFDKRYFVTEEWTSDISNKYNGSYVESNKNPDMVIRYKPTGEEFAVECKYRSAFTYSERIDDVCVQWSYPEQIKRYNEFQQKRQMPVFIVIGIGGESDIRKKEIPELMFCIPLIKAKYPEIFPSVLQQYERNPYNNFFWKSGILT
ncbi:MAG: hypothetical protein PHF65_08345 [Oscillospiraceae bacterium]|nr:hypothetical protein [Oscillospiraceae bacterium]